MLNSQISLYLHEKQDEIQLMHDYMSYLLLCNIFLCEINGKTTRTIGRYKYNIKDHTQIWTDMDKTRQKCHIYIYIYGKIHFKKCSWFLQKKAMLWKIPKALFCPNQDTLFKLFKKCLLSVQENRGWGSRQFLQCPNIS